MFEVELSTQIWLLLCGAAMLAGFVDAIAGGGGLLTVPALLAAGLPAHVVLGTNKLAATFGSFAASLTYYKKQLFSPTFWLYSAIATAFGAITGTLLVDLISSRWLEKVLPLIIIAIGVYSLFQGKHHTYVGVLPPKTKALKQKQLCQGAGLGFYDGFAGPGTGAFWLVSNMSLYKLDILLASGLAKAMNFISNITSLVTFIYLGHVNWLIGVAMGSCLMLGSFLGAHSAIRFGAKFIRPVFILAVVAIAIKLAYQAW